MAESIEFFFDFASPYGYLASERIEATAEKHGRSVVWRPFLVGAAMKVSERKPLVSIPLVGDYAVHDVNGLHATGTSPSLFQSLASCYGERLPRLLSS